MDDPKPRNTLDDLADLFLTGGADGALDDYAGAQ